MNFNYNKLKGRIVEKYGTQGAFAEAMNVSERTLSKKLTGKGFFTQGEMALAVELLDIPEAEINVYFFTQQVQSC